MILDPIPISVLDNFKKKKSIKNLKAYSKVLNNLKYSFEDKINFEYAKSYLFLKKNYFLSKQYLEKIVYKKMPTGFHVIRALHY